MGLLEGVHCWGHDLGALRLTPFPVALSASGLLLTMQATSFPASVARPPFCPCRLLFLQTVAADKPFLLQGASITVFYHNNRQLI